MRRAIIVSLFVYLFVGAGGVRPATPADAGCADPSPSNPSPADPDSQRWIGLYQIDPQCNPTKETPCVFVDATMFDAEFVHPRAYAGANAGGALPHHSPAFARQEGSGLEIQSPGIRGK
jgi:hypothetical protein